MPTSQADAAGPPFAVTIVLAGLGALAAGWLVWLGAAVHLERACVVMDTPYLPICPVAEADTERQHKLRSRLARNPGDSSAWIHLTNLEIGDREKALSHAAATLAPTDPNVLMWRVGEALANNQLPQATALLVQLVEYRGRGEAVQALARIVASGEGTALLRAHLATASRWLPQVLASMAPLKLPLTSALPLLVEASARGTVPKGTTQAYIRALKADGKWADAYGLWIAQQKAPTPLLHNGSFDQPFQPDGFDWELPPALPSRAGAVVSQRPAVNRSQVLDIQFTGRPLALPIIRQYVFAPPGKYVLRGKYMSSKLRMEEGLAWVARCTSGNTAALAGKSDGLQDTGGAWKSFQFSLAIPSSCGLVISLQLETFAPSAALTGDRGRVGFDALELLWQGL